MIEENLVNLKYTFDNFVVGDNNRFAHAMALAIAKSPSKIYNPSFIYGENGLGKTHLMHAIENKILENFPNFKVIYISSNEFVNELINYIKKDKTEAFRKKYKSFDVILIDDIQFIVGKERIQEEVLYVLKSLYKDGKQLVISSDRSLENTFSFEDRLKYGFLRNGLIADISKYDFSTRLEILRREVKRKNIEIDDKIISTIAKKFSCNIMELKGALNIVVAYSNLLDEELSEEKLNNIIEGIMI